MPLLVHSGSGSTDLGTTNTKREDISEILLASLIPENNVLGLMPIGAEVVDTQFRWLEDKLNNTSITDTTGGGQSSGSTTLTVSAADAAVLDIGYILSDEASGGVATGEQVQVTAVQGTSVTVTRGYGGTTAVTHAQNATWRIIASPTYENSDLGRDMSRARITKNNVIQRFELNVNISQEQIKRAMAGAAPGVPDEMEYQFRQRLREMLRKMNNTLLYGRASSTSTPITGDYSTTEGMTGWLDGTYNATATPQAQGGAALTDTMLNSLNKTLIRNGAVPDWIIVGTNGAEALSKLYNDRIRIEQSDETRGFKVKYFDTTLQNQLRILFDNAVIDTAPNGILFLVDSGRMMIRPFIDSFFYLIEAPSFRDGDAMRALSKWGFEIRNTGTDVGAAHLLATGLAY